MLAFLLGNWMWKSGSIHLRYLLQSRTWTVKMVHFIKGRSRVVSMAPYCSGSRLTCQAAQVLLHSRVCSTIMCYQHNNNHCVHNLQQCAILHNASVFFQGSNVSSELQLSANDNKIKGEEKKAHEGIPHCVKPFCSSLSAKLWLLWIFCCRWWWPVWS